MTKPTACLPAGRRKPWVGKAIPHFLPLSPSTDRERGIRQRTDGWGASNPGLAPWAK